MINMMMPAIPTDLPVTLQTLSDLISLLADPGAAKQRLADMQATIATLQQSADEQKTQIAAFTVAKADHQRTLKAATAEQAAKLAADKAAFDAECARRKSDLDNRESQLTQL